MAAYVRQLEKGVCQCGLMSHLHRRGKPKLLAQTAGFWIEASVLLASNGVQICESELRFIVRYVDLLRGCVHWLIEWNRARYSVSDVTRGYFLLMQPAVSLLTYLRGRMGAGGHTIPRYKSHFVPLSTLLGTQTNNPSQISQSEK